MKMVDIKEMEGKSGKGAEQLIILIKYKYCNFKFCK